MYNTNNKSKPTEYKTWLAAFALAAAQVSALVYLETKCSPDKQEKKPSAVSYSKRVYDIQTVVEDINGDGKYDLKTEYYRQDGIMMRIHTTAEKSVAHYLKRSSTAKIVEDGTLEKMIKKENKK